jgi:DNA primase
VIPEEVVAEVVRRTDIVELIGSYLPLRAAGRTHKALCPFHTEKTPSFVVNPERQIFHCFGCGEGGDAIAFLVKHDRLTFVEAVRLLAARAGVTLPASRGGRAEEDGRLLLLEIHRQALAYFRENLGGPEGAAAREYLAGRGVTAGIVDRFQLGYALPRWDGLLRALKQRGHADRVLEATGLCVPRQRGTGLYDRFRQRLMIPIWDVSGKTIAFGGRALPPAEVRAGDGSEVKYLNSPETALYRKGTHLYGLNLAAKAIRERKTAVVVEGYFDAIMLHVHGFDHAVAALGTALTPDQARLLARYADRVILLFDPDAAGIGAARRSLEQLVNVDLEWRVVVLPGGQDPDAFVRVHGAEAFQRVLNESQDLVDFFLDRRVSGLDMGDPVQRARGAEGLVEVIGAIDSPVRREGYLARVAQRTGISDRALLEEIAQRRGRGGRRDAAAAPAGPAPAPPSAEEQVIFIGLHYPGHRERIRNGLAPEDIRDPILQRIYREWIQAESGEDLRAAGRMGQLPPEVQRRLSALWARDLVGDPGEAQTPEDSLVVQTMEDCLTRIRERRTRADRTALRQALEAADRGKDAARVLELLADHPSVKGGQQQP